MELLIEYYISTNTIRNQEYLECIKKNINNIYINKIHIFIDDKNVKLDLVSDKLNIIYIEKRFTYSDFFKYASQNLPNTKVILANTDIFFDDTLEVVDKFEMKNVVLALTRHEYKNGKSELFYVDMSQDAWVFQTPISVNDADFLLGKPGCDNRIAYLLHDSNYDVRNPSQQVKIYHMHDSAFRTYNNNDIIQGLYMTILPNNNIFNPSYKKIIEKF